MGCGSRMRLLLCSGGGAGGPGHPSRSNCPPGNGGHGGGFIMISVKELSNEGLIKSGGNNGFPDRNYCQWPNGNPQSGSGGAGAGGFIKSVARPLFVRWQRRAVRVASGGRPLSVDEIISCSHRMLISRRISL